MNTTRIVVDHAGSSKSALLKFYKEPSDWGLVSLSGQRSQATQLPYGFACNTYRFGWIPQVLEVSKMSLDSFLAIFQECPFWCLHAKTAISHVTKQGIRPFLQGALTGFKIQSELLKVFWWHAESRHGSFHQDIPDKGLVNKTTFGNRCYYTEYRFILGLCKQTYSHENNTHSLKVAKFWRNYVGRKKVNVSILLMRVKFANCPRGKKQVSLYLENIKI